MDLELRLRGKSTTQSHRTPIYYVDITTPAGSSLEASVNEARQRQEHWLQAGLDQRLLDEAARNGYALGEFEESEEDAVGVVEEFFTAAGLDEQQKGSGQEALLRPKVSLPTLAHKLQQKASGSTNAAAAA